MYSTVAVMEFAFEAEAFFTGIATPRMAAIEMTFLVKVNVMFADVAEL